MTTVSPFKDRGLRTTKTRKMILESLSTDPLSTKEIFQKIKRGNRLIDLVTVYRNVHLLTSLGVISEIELGEGKKRYELNKGHHHHLVCEKCGDIKDINFEEDYLEKFIRLHTDFFVKRHSLEFFGLCTNCRP